VALLVPRSTAANALLMIEVGSYCCPSADGPQPSSNTISDCFVKDLRFRFRDRGDELGASPFFDNVLCRLTILIEFPVARWVPAGGLQYWMIKMSSPSFCAICDQSFRAISTAFLYQNNGRRIVPCRQYRCLFSYWQRNRLMQK
jgi:hypothetical protein